MDHAYREQQWEGVRRIAGALTIDGIHGFLPVRGYWSDLRVRLEQAVFAAEAEGRQREAAAFAANLAELLRRTGDLETARQEYQRVLAIFEALGEREAVATVYHQLGMLAHDAGNYVEAGHLYQQSLDIEEALENQAGIASSCISWGCSPRPPGSTLKRERCTSAV